MKNQYKELPKGYMYTPVELVVGDTATLPIYNHMCEGDGLYPMRFVWLIHAEGNGKANAYLLEMDVSATKEENGDDTYFLDLKVVYNVVNEYWIDIDELLDGR